MVSSVEHVSEQIFGIIKGFGHTIVLFTDGGKKTTDPTEARRFYAKDIGMMVNFVVDESTNELVVNLSKDTDIKRIAPMLSGLRNLANRYIIEYTVKTFGKSIGPKDFAYQAKNIGESTMDSKREYDRNQRKLAKLAKDRNAAKKAGNPWKVMDPKEKEFHRIKTQMNEVFATNAKRLKVKQTGSRPGEYTDLESYDVYYDSEKVGEVETGEFGNIHGHIFNKTLPSDNNLQVSGGAVRKHLARFLQSPNGQRWLNNIDKYRNLDGPTNDYRLKTNRKKEESMMEDINEGFSGWHGSARKSINELGDAKLIVKHRRNVDEEKRGARTRQIESIFIENSEGERFKFPSKNVTAAKAMVRHVKEGGTPFDDFGQYIYETMEELNQLKTFQRKNRRNDFFEDATINEEIVGRVGKLRETLKQISGIKGYAHHFETFSRNGGEISKEQLDELKDNVTVQYFDEGIADSLPYVAKIIEAMRTRKSLEAQVVEFAKYVMDNKDSIVFTNPIDDADPENPAARSFRDPATALAAWVTYLAPKVKDDQLANYMMNTAELIHEVGKPHLNMAAAAINVIKQKGKVAEASEIGNKNVSIDEDEISKINETFAKYDVRKIFGV